MNKIQLLNTIVHLIRSPEEARARQTRRTLHLEALGLLRAARAPGAPRARLGGRPERRSAGRRQNIQENIEKHSNVTN